MDSNDISPIIRSEPDSGQNESQNIPAARGTGKKAPRANSSVKPVFGKLRYPLTSGTDKAVRLAAIFLEDTPNAPSTPQQLVEVATVAYLKKLRTTKGFDIPTSLLPE